MRVVSCRVELDGLSWVLLCRAVLCCDVMYCDVCVLYYAAWAAGTGTCVYMGGGETRALVPSDVVLSTPVDDPLASCSADQ